MAIIYTYPVKTTPAGNDLILISDSADSNKTKQIKVSSLPSSGAGITLTTTGTSGVATLTGSVLNIPNYATGGTPSLPLNGVQYRNANGNFEASSNLTFTTNTLTVGHTAVIKGQGNLLPAGRLKLNCEQNSNAITLEGPANSGGANYTLKFPSPAPTNNQILEYTTSGNLGWIATPSGSGGAVDSVVTTSGTYVDLSPSSAAIGAVTVTADLNAVDGTSDKFTRFLSKDNTWDVPSYTTNTDTTYTGSSGITLTGTNFTNADRGSSQFIFKNIAVSGQNTVVADSNNDTLTLAAGNNITLTTDNTTDTVTIESSGGSAGGHCSVDWADGSSSLQMGTPIRFYRFTNTSTFTATKGWIFVTDNAEAGGESPLLFRLGIYSGSNMGTTNGLTLLGSGVSSASPSIGLLGINLTAASGQSLALSSGTSYYLALVAQNGLNATAVAGKTASTSVQTVALNTAGTLPAATSLPTNAPGEGQSFSANNLIFACTLV